MITTTSIIVSTITSQVTTTIPPNAGFTPLASAIASAGGIANMKRFVEDARERPGDPNALYRPAEMALEPRAAASAVCTLGIGPGNKPVLSPAQYPASVSCNELVEVVTISTSTYTASITATSAAPKPTITQVRKRPEIEPLQGRPTDIMLVRLLFPSKQPRSRRCQSMLQQQSRRQRSQLSL